MNDKKQKLIEIGMKLIAEKGYYNTSIQEIANEAGVSKGSFYIYFSSKEAFIATAIHNFHQRISEEMKQMQQDSNTPRENFANQLAVSIDYIYCHKDYIFMFIRENISLGENIDKLIYNLKVENFNWMKSNLKAIYQEEMDEMDAILIDIIIQAEGLLSGYFKWLMIEDIQIDSGEAGAFLVRRIDDLVKGMLHRKEEPLIGLDQVPNAYSFAEMDQKRNEIQIALKLLKMNVEAIQLDEIKKAQLHEVISALQKEVDQDEYQSVVVQGLLAHFYQFPELKEETEQLADLFDVELLS
ncbi:MULTISPECIES: TetR/AcrR family transcriptional regulator [Virgibacillus]|uniref:HTH-type transcriptional regulator YuxN n=2 Tax=Virgibacillus TaxID=84406 RepID=A0ABQ2DCN6_9BACI|nr:MULTISPECIES: TetR/AcrR family transcriptional regulator [Virgibacillus]EQB38163.1 hypothetical protein M948_06195 [Virgibacillus sp. CM-4]MYL40869.1 TetR family transcriptional regulator [Virgibacillus massiliensis]GGJ52447.1 putative HTH-type transcriptional regulator YuxN [Virgibacillus kapii]CDQ38333.1 putative HTH-type transcriptional regulator YvdT [Virgibacillus massiliensis]